tara:strand:+ start:251 stop:703 length:453 start_codon:yes stop_codon:yes gene_type:complete
MAGQEHGKQDVGATATAAKPALAHVRDEWSWVKQGIEEILAEQPQLTFRPEDVYAACLNEEAYLWVAPEGFVITTAERDEFTGARTFFLWLAWAKDRGQSCAIKYISFFTSVAKENGFENIETRTPVTALEKYFLADGWKKETVVYTREL